MKQQTRFIIFFVLTLIEQSVQQTFGEIIANKQLDKVPVEEQLSAQINKLALVLSGQTLKNYESLSKQYSTSEFVKYGFIADQQTYESFQNINSQAAQIQFSRSFLSLPQFFILNELRKKDQTYQPYLYEQDIGSDYASCKLCSGKYFQIDYEYLNLNINLSFSPLIESNTYLWRFHDNQTKTQEYMVEAFQILWNCNFPNNPLEITKIFDEKTQNMLKISSSFGFTKVCKTCNDSLCEQCSSLYDICYSCIEGYNLVEGKCIRCTVQNCQMCSKNNSNEDICVQCKKDHYLFNQACVKQCPEGTHTGKDSCITCSQGQYFNGESCQNCSSYCKKCSGSSGEECSECQFGFIKENNKCIVCNDDSKCPGAVCLQNQFRQLEQPFQCGQCDTKCKTCSNSGPASCLSCPDGLRLVGNRCSDIVYKPATYLDPITGQTKQCNFSCSECTDNTNLCKECNRDLNYFIKDGSKKICYSQCPKNYVAKDNGQTLDFYECIISDSYTEDQRAADLIQQEAKNRCSDYTFWDGDSQNCIKCANRCLSCTAKDNCDECSPGYYWDEQQLMCLACHTSCKKCTGPLFSQCILCKDFSKMYPNSQGVCDLTTTQSLAPTISKVPSSNEIFGDMKTCQVSYSDQLKNIYTVKIFQPFSTQENEWKDTALISTNTTCRFVDFKGAYSSLKDNTSTCTGINKSKMSTKGQMTVIYAILLNQSSVKLEGKDVNPGSLAKYAIENSKYSTYYIYKPRGKFSCDRLSCESSLDNFMSGFDRGRNQTVSIKSTDEIVFTSKGEYINCHDSAMPVYDQEPIKELEQTVSQARISVNTNSKVYFLLDACVTGSDGKQKKKTFLATDFYEKGFIRALDVESQTEDQKYNIFYIQGAFKSENEYLKKCNPQYKNSFTSYLVTRVKKVEVEHENIEIDQAEAQANQIGQKNNSTQTTEQPKNCTCIQTKQYILQNEGQNGELYRVISPQDTILTKSIKVTSVQDILKLNRLDPLKMKVNKISISTILAFRMFDQYLERITTTANNCYGLSSSSNQCIQNVLIDIVFSNNGSCINQSELRTAASKNDYLKLIQIIKDSSYCRTQSIRCAKHQQILKGCQ